MLSVRFLAIVSIAVALEGPAIALSCRPPPARWEVSSANDQFKLILTHEEGAADTELRLVRVLGAPPTAWAARSSQRYHWGAAVSDDGAYTATIDGCGDTEMTLRNSKGEVVRSIAERELASIWERLNGGILRFREFDIGLGILAMEVAFDPSQVRLEARTRRIRLSDGAVLDPPIEPADFDLPVLECEKPNELVRDLSPFGLIVVSCGHGSMGDGPVRIYSWEKNRLRLWASGQWRQRTEDGRWWSANSERSDQKGPCETVYRDGEVVSQRCGPDVAAPPQ